jgi:hypothetical protein
MTIAHSTATRNATAVQVVQRIDAGSAAGKIKFYTAGFGTLMATGTFADPSFDTGAVANGSVSTVAGAIVATITSVGTNVMAKFRIEDSDSNEVLTGDVGLTGADINLTNTTFNQNDSVTINSLTYTAMP